MAAAALDTHHHSTKNIPESNHHSTKNIPESKSLLWVRWPNFLLFDISSSCVLQVPECVLNLHETKYL
jgi:hypothetical protein